MVLEHSAIWFVPEVLDSLCQISLSNDLENLSMGNTQQARCVIAERSEPSPPRRAWLFVRSRRNEVDGFS